jgi:Na+/melibiose symporter-like transporter
MSLLASIRATAANRAFYYVMAYLICFGIAAGILGAFLTFANRYVLHGDAQSLAVLGSIFGIFGIAGLPLAPLAVRYLGEARGMRIANLAVAIAFSLLFAASYGPIWLSWIAVGGIGLFAGALGVLMRTTLIDVARVELKNAVVVPLGVYLGIMIAGLKLGASGGTFAAGELLDVIGFVSGGVRQSASTIAWLRAGYTLFPVAWLIAGGLFLRHISTSFETADRKTSGDVEVSSLPNRG